MDILSAIGSVVTGGATGLIGIGVQRYFDMKNKQLDLQIIDKKNLHEIAMRKVDAEIMAQETAARTKVAEIEASAAINASDAQAFSASFNVEPARYSDGVKPSNAQGWVFVLLDFIRGIVRPGLTMYLCVLTTLIYFQAQAHMDKILDGVQYFKLVEEIIDTVLYLFVTCTCWWFGVRNKGKQPKA